MTTTQDSRLLPRRRPGPKPRGRTVVPLTITVTHAQRAELEARADSEKSSISTVVRRFVAAGLAADIFFGLFILTALIETTITRRSGANTGTAHREHASPHPRGLVVGYPVPVCATAARTHTTSRGGGI